MKALAFVAICVSLGFVACGDEAEQCSGDVSSAIPGDWEACTDTSNCATDLTCYGIAGCHKPCDDDTDCPCGWKCIEPGGGGACFQICIEDEDCPGTLTCTIYEACVG